MSTGTAVDRNALRRDEIVKAAYDLFLSKGYRNVGVADIVSRIGVSHGTFYNYFDNKRHVLDAVIDHSFNLISEHVLQSEPADAAQTMDEFCAGFSQIIDRFYELVASEPGMTSFMMFEALSIDEHVVERVMTNFQTYSKAARDRILNGVDRGFLRADLDAWIAGEAMLSVMMSAMVSAIRDGEDGLTPEQVNAGLTDFVRAGFGLG